MLKQALLEMKPSIADLSSVTVLMFKEVEVL
jgi:hypothetical protein